MLLKSTQLITICSTDITKNYAYEVYLLGGSSSLTGKSGLLDMYCMTISVTIIKRKRRTEICSNYGVKLCSVVCLAL